MSSAKKIQTTSDDDLNAKIQRKFDLVFNQNKSRDSFEDSLEFTTKTDEEFVMEKNGKKSQEVKTSIDLDFSLDFNLDDQLETKPTASVEATPFTGDLDDDNDGFILDDSDLAINNDEATKKTVMVNLKSLTNSNLEEFTLEKTGGHTNSTADLMSTEEAKANIESTIKDIIRPKLDETKEILLDGLKSSGGTGILDEIEDSELSFSDDTPPKGFVLDSIMGDDAFTLDPPSLESKASTSTPVIHDSTGEFDLNDLDTSFKLDDEVLTKDTSKSSTRTSDYEAPPSMGLGGSNITTEDSMRFQATIRALREEREEMLAQIKSFKADSKELEQDNLTLKANLDEAKIEITILRKRHMLELEDIKYRLAMSDEKRAMADEKARQADMRREKLEQKVRIDFNQVKQREKELESKLELLSMDVDSQVQGRDQKILELRRKIDALEFNMENASIKEQKSLDDKRKLEDRLNKIMKTLRHSIKNLEDDIDHAEEDSGHQKDKN